MADLLEPQALRRTQGWMQAVITDPAGIRAGIAAEVARREMDVSFENLETVVSRSRFLTCAERLRIYSRSYHLRLLEAFRSEFPCVRRALGDDTFTHFVAEYLRRYPPRSYTLHDLARDFPRFLADTRPDSAKPPEARETWPDFIIDLARFERAFIETYDGPGSEGQAIADSREIQGMSDLQLSRLRLVPSPCLRLLSFRYPVLPYFRAAREKGGPEWPAPRTNFLAMSRKNFIVRFLELSAAQYHTLGALAVGLSVGEASAHAAGQAGQGRESLANIRRNWLRDWLDGGLFLKLISDDQEPE